MQSLTWIRTVGLVVLLAFLFSFIGIAASDFLIPNLATITDFFGLDDNIAGVTFLAFGNGRYVPRGGQVLNFGKNAWADIMTTYLVLTCSQRCLP